jgi:hypothetical protein
MDTFTLENQTLCLEFSCENGALVGLSAIESDWQLLNRPQLGLSFCLLVPTRGSLDWHEPGHRNNLVLGEDQKLTSLKVATDGRSAILVWDGVTSKYGGRHDIKLTLNVKLTERQAIFSLKIDNRSNYIIENVYFPYLGDIQHPPVEEWFKTFINDYNSAVEWSLWPTYQSLVDYCGTDHAVQFGRFGLGIGAPMAPFILLRGEKQGLYAGVCESSSELVAWHTELRPGYGSSIDSRVPEGLSINNEDVATRFAAVHLPFIQPGETRSLTPIALEIYQGGWQAGVDIYKKWRNSWMKLPKIPAWAKGPHSWQQIHINSSEDELRIRFEDLSQIGEDCVKFGVKAIQLVGWNDGGQDQGNPSHNPDPRLGTVAELKDAIAKIQSLGVKVILFSKFTWADRATERFRNDLIRFAIKDPYGDYYHFAGWLYQTATQLLDINTKRLIPMCFLSEEYLQICNQEFQNLVDLGADGILFDECLHHSPALLCFDAGHGHRYGASVYANDRELIHRFARITQPINSDFLFAGEGCYDWEMETYHMSYHRSWNKEHIPLSRYLLPEGLFMTAVNGFNDRNMINQCLLYRYVISYEPHNFKGRLIDYPLTMAYGNEMDALRTELREYFWDGEFRHELGAHVTSDNQPHHPYAVFIDRTTGKVGVVVANYDERQTVTVKVELEQTQVLNRYRLVDDPTWRLSTNGITLPPCSAAVVIE